MEYYPIQLPATKAGQHVAGDETNPGSVLGSVLFLGYINDLEMMMMGGSQGYHPEKVS